MKPRPRKRTIELVQYEMTRKQVEVGSLQALIGAGFRQKAARLREAQVEYIALESEHKDLLAEGPGAAIAALLTEVAQLRADVAQLQRAIVDTRMGCVTADTTAVAKKADRG